MTQGPRGPFEFSALRLRDVDHALGLLVEIARTFGVLGHHSCFAVPCERPSLATVSESGSMAAQSVTASRQKDGLRLWGRMTWEVYERVNRRRRELRRLLSDEAIRRLERKGLAVRNKSAVEVRKLIAATFSSHRHRPHA
jgi:hypothetical protein